MWQSNEQVTDIYRTTLKSTLDMMNIYLGGVERLRDYQAGAVEEMRSSYNEILKRIGSLSSLPELHAAYAELARSQTVRMVSYWNGLVGASGQYQAEILNEALGKTQEVTEEIGQKLKTAPAAAVPALSAIKIALDAAQSTYAATARATEELAHLSAAQIEAVKAPAARRGNGVARKHAAV